MSHRSPDRNELIVSHMFLRQTVGWIGSLLPIVLLVGTSISSTALRPDSISGYYDTDMRKIFAGTQSAFGECEEYDNMHRWITKIADFSGGLSLLRTVRRGNA